jgi:fermentation-respiration switch protein FrsA (DUF1100 family)
MKAVKFKNRNWEVAGILQFPKDFDETKKYPAIVCAHPISSCKEQTAGNIYGKALAEAGFITLLLMLPIKVKVAVRYDF